MEIKINRLEIIISTAQTEALIIELTHTIQILEAQHGTREASETMYPYIYQLLAKLRMHIIIETQENKN